MCNCAVNWLARVLETAAVSKNGMTSAAAKIFDFPVTCKKTVELLESPVDVKDRRIQAMTTYSAHRRSVTKASQTKKKRGRTRKHTVVYKWKNNNALTTVMIGTFLDAHLTYNPNGTTGFAAYLSASTNATNATNAPAKSPMITGEFHVYASPPRLSAMMRSVSQETRKPMPRRSSSRMADLMVVWSIGWGMCTA